jgi:hypothetical protein
MIEKILNFYFLVNMFLTGIIYEQYKDEYKWWYLVIMCSLFSLFAIPMIILYSLIGWFKELYWLVYNFLYIGYIIRYLSGKWDNLEQWQIDKLKDSIPKVKYFHQKYILQLILRKQKQIEK